MKQVPAPLNLSPIERLPAELLEQVVKYAVPPDPSMYVATDPGFRGLASMNLASKTLRNFTKPLLYQNFATTNSSVANLRPFIRTLLREPQLALRLENIAIHSWQPDPTFRIPDEDVQVRLAYVSNRIPASSRVWKYNVVEDATPQPQQLPRLIENTLLYQVKEAISAGEIVGDVAILLLLAINAQHISIHTPPRRPFELRTHRASSILPGLLMAVSAGQFGHPQMPLGKVRTVALNRGVPTGCTFEGTMPLLRYLVGLPQLDSLTASNFSSEFSAYVRQWPNMAGSGNDSDRFCRVTKFNFDSAILNSFTVVELLEKVRTLEELKISWLNRIVRSHMPGVVVNLPKIGAALHHHAATLRKLSLTIRWENSARNLARISGLRTGQLGPLRAFRALEHLEISDILICEDCDPMRISCLAWVLEDVNVYFPPNLQKLVLHTRKDPRLLHNLVQSLARTMPETMQTLEVTCWVHNHCLTEAARESLNQLRISAMPWLWLQLHPHCERQEIVVLRIEVPELRNDLERVLAIISSTFPLPPTSATLPPNMVTEPLAELFAEWDGSIAEMHPAVVGTVI